LSVLVQMFDEELSEPSYSELTLSLMDCFVPLAFVAATTRSTGIEFSKGVSPLCGVLCFFTTDGFGAEMLVEHVHTGGY